MMTTKEFTKCLLAPGNIERLSKEFELACFNSSSDFPSLNMEIPIWKQATNWQASKVLSFGHMESVSIALHNLPDEWDRARPLIHSKLFN